MTSGASLSNFPPKLFACSLSHGNTFQAYCCYFLLYQDHEGYTDLDHTSLSWHHKVFSCHYHCY